MNKKSCYNMICEALKNGELPQDFELPAETEGDEISWADGAEDGVYLYHMPESEPNAEGKKLIAGALLSANKRNFGDADKFLAALAGGCRAVCAWDALVQYIGDNSEVLIPQNIFDYAMRTVCGSADRECVKLGLCMLSALDNCSEDEVRSVVKTLALSDEFTLYAIYIMRKWPDGNDAIFETAGKVHGWGRIHAVEFIEPETDEIRSWLLTEGVHNKVMSAYSALTCWEKSGAGELLRRCRKQDAQETVTDISENMQKEEFFNRLTGEQFEGIRDIIEGLLDEGPCSGISAVEDACGAVSDFLSCAEDRSLDARDFDVIQQIKEYFCAQSDAESGGSDLKDGIQEQIGFVGQAASDRQKIVRACEKILKGKEDQSPELDADWVAEQNISRDTAQDADWVAEQIDDQGTEQKEDREISEKTEIKWPSVLSS